MPAGRLPLIDAAWPVPATMPARRLRLAALVIAGVALLTVSAKLNLPLPFVPMTLQTLVVLVIGAAFGWRLGALTMLAYLAIGAAGLAVFAGAVGGLKPLFGATAGFLFGFVAAAALTGWLAQRGWDRSLLRLVAAMAIGHAVILVVGWAWLAFGLQLGAAKAFVVGVLPFLAGTVVKTVCAAALVALGSGAARRAATRGIYD